MPHVRLDRPAEYADLVAVPEHLVAEIVDGELWTSPRPSPRHTRVSSALGIDLGGPYDRGHGGPGGWWILDEPELHLGSDVLVPDLDGWRRLRMARLPDTAYFSLAPDWVCEVLSPHTARLDRTSKLRIYARESVAHAWLIDPDARTVEVLRLESGRWVLVTTHGGTERVQAEPFDAIAIDLSTLWGGTGDDGEPTAGPA